MGNCLPTKPTTKTIVVVVDPTDRTGDKNIDNAAATKPPNLDSLLPSSIILPSHDDSGMVTSVENPRKLEQQQKVDDDEKEECVATKSKPCDRNIITITTSVVVGTNNSIIDGSLQQQQPSFLMHMIPDEIWISGILPFVGPGEYIFVAGICKKLKKLYGEYFLTLGEDEIPLVSFWRTLTSGGGWRHKAIMTDTFYSSAFASVSRAKFWDQYTARDRNRLRNDDVCPMMAKHGYLDALKWASRQKRSLLRKRFPWGGSAANAARGGHLKVLKWARDNGCPWSYRIIELAAKGGHLHVIKWLREKGFPWTKFICACAAEGGHLHVLQWARHNGCPWDSWTCAYAAMNGHLHALKWARENGCPWDYRTPHYETNYGHQEIEDWLGENGYQEP